MEPTQPLPTPVELSGTARLRRREGVILRHVVGEHMLVPAVTREIDLDSLFLLNVTGVTVWEQLDGQRTVQDLGVLVAQSAGIAPETAATDVALFLSSLLGRKLVEQM